MEMHQVRYFLAVTRTLNFTRAAAECNVAQPSLTRAIKLLEAELGGDLFRRERNFTHVTEFGQRMLPLLRQCYESAVSAKTLATSLRKGTVAALTLSLSRAVDLTLLVDPLRELVRVFPSIELKILRGTPAEVAEHLKRGEAAFAVSGPLGETWDRLDAWPLFEEPFVAAVGAGHRFADAASVSFTELARERLLWRPYCELAAEMDAEAERLGAPITRGHEVVAETDLMRLVEADLGVALLPASTPTPTAVRRLAVEGLAIERVVTLYGVAGRERSAAESAFLKLLRARDWSGAATPSRAAA